MVPEEKRTRLFLHLKKWLEKAVMDYSMIAEEDKVLVGVSGGMDSMALLDLLNTPMVHVPPFSLTAVHIDPGFDLDGAGSGILARHLKAGGYDAIVEKSDIGPLSHSEVNRKNPCFLCSWERRKRLFRLAHQLQCNKVALGHHKDDIIETLLLNIFYSGEISTMLPLQTLFKGKITLIRPLALIEEKKIKRFAQEMDLPFGPSGCPSSGKTKRKEVKELIEAVQMKNHRVKGNIFRSLSNVKLDYTLTEWGKKSPITSSLSPLEKRER